MTDPVDTARDGDFRNDVSAVAAALRPLHRALVESSRSMYELEFGPIDGPNAMLQLLMADPEFAWLRELSGLMAEVDELLDLSSVTSDDAAAVRSAVEGLVDGPDTDAGFSARYREALQADMDVVVAHGRVRAALAALPVAADPHALKERRKGWPARRVDERRR